MKLDQAQKASELIQKIEHLVQMKDDVCRANKIKRIVGSPKSGDLDVNAYLPLSVKGFEDMLRSSIVSTIEIKIRELQREIEAL